MTVRSSAQLLGFWPTYNFTFIIFYIKLSIIEKTYNACKLIEFNLFLKTRYPDSLGDNNRPPFVEYVMIKS